MRLILLLAISSIAINSSAQNNKPLVVLDKVFTLYDSSYILQNIDRNLIIDIEFIEAEKAWFKFGDVGKNGLLFITTDAPKSPQIKKLKENSYKNGDGMPNFIVDNQDVDGNYLESIDPHQIEKIEILYPLDAVTRFGKEYINGLVIITIKK